MPRPLRGFLPFALVVALVSGCDTSSAIFSDADRRSIYSLTALSSAGKSLAGASLLPGESVRLSLSNMTGSKAPESLAVSIEDGTGKAIASLVYATAKAGGVGASPVLVDSLSGSLPSFQLPADLVPGVYTLVTSLADESGARLQSGRLVFFIGPQGFDLGSLSVYPPTSAPSQPVLFSVGVRTGEPASSPWLRWSADGRLLSEGSLADGYDKVVWTAPQLDGAYAIKVELFPARPGPTLDLPSPWRQEIKAIVSKDAAMGPDEYGDGSKLLSHLGFEGDLADSGTRPQPQGPSVLGKPALEVYPGGFGYRLGETSGVLLPGAVPPQSGGLGSAFSLLWRFYTQQPGGDLLRVASVEGSLLLRAGLENGSPFVETYDQDGKHRSVAPASVSPGLVDLALSFEPVNGKYELVWSVNGQRVPAPAVPMRTFPDTAVARLGGPASLSGIYDEFAISDDSTGSPPFFHAAALRAWKAGLMVAEGFESRSLPDSMTAGGSVTLAPRRLGLGQGGSLVLNDELDLRRPLLVATTWDGSDSPFAVELSADGNPLVTVMSSGEIRGPDGAVLGTLRPLDAGKLTFIAKALPDGLEISLSGGLPAGRLSLKPPPKALNLALRAQDSAGSIWISSILVRAAPEALTLADAPRTARLR
jgi:hypothetical protein